MKKIILVFLLFAVLATASVFADHPEGWGVGAVGSTDLRFGYFQAGLSLKTPFLPVFWGLYASFGENYLGFGLTGDYYLIDQALVPNIGMNWFVGIGGDFSMSINSHDSWWDYHNYDGPDTNKYGHEEYSTVTMFAGARVPVGMNFQIPIPDSSLTTIEFFFNLAPTFGLNVDFGYSYDNYYWEGSSSVGWTEKKEKREGSGSVNFDFYFPVQLGVRFWF